ncbi:MAG: HIT family protein [Acidiferrobacteraceae bacterium]
MITNKDCPLCTFDGGRVIYRDGGCRVVIAGEETQTEMCRVILDDHVAEMTDLSVERRGHLMALVFATEAAVRAVLRPDKVNLASLGNQVPHLHWHVIPRFYDDACFPDPIWASPRRTARGRRIDAEAIRRCLRDMRASGGES